MAHLRAFQAPRMNLQTVSLSCCALQRFMGKGCVGSKFSGLMCCGSCSDISPKLHFAMHLPVPTPKAEFYFRVGRKNAATRR